MDGKYTEYARKVNYYETDQMGIVHHSNYIRYFEEARLDMMEKMELAYDKMEEMGIIMPVTFVDCKYLVPLRFGQEMVIKSQLIKYDGIKCEIAYEIYQKGSDKICTTGRSGHCFLDRELKPIRMKREYPEIYKDLKELVQQ